MTKIFESILDNDELVSSTVSPADLIASSDYEFPSFDNYPHILMLCNGSDNYDNLVDNPKLISERFELLQNALSTFRHISHSDFVFRLYEDDYSTDMPYYIKPRDLTDDFVSAYPGFFVAFDSHFRSEKETIRFVYILNQIATGNAGGSITIYNQNWQKLFIDFEQIDWVAEYNKLPFVKLRLHNAFYDKRSISNLSERLYYFLKPNVFQNS